MVGNCIQLHSPPTSAYTSTTRRSSVMGRVPGSGRPGTPALSFFVRGDLRVADSLHEDGTLRLRGVAIAALLQLPRVYRLLARGHHLCARKLQGGEGGRGKGEERMRRVSERTTPKSPHPLPVQQHAPSRLFLGGKQTIPFGETRYGASETCQGTQSDARTSTRACVGASGAGRGREGEGATCAVPVR
jgi:hypothetical protein